MGIWALRTLLVDRWSALTAVAGVAVAFLLVLIIEGMFVGESSQIVAYLRESPADVWIMQDGVSNMHMATSFVNLDKVDEIRKVPGVAEVVPILYLNAFVTGGTGKRFAYVIGLPPRSPWGGPWKMVEGETQLQSGEAIIPHVLAGMFGLRIGDPIRILDRSFTVIGFSAETFSMANSVIFITFNDLEDIIGSFDVASYILVRAAPGVHTEELATRICDEVEDIAAIAREPFIANDRVLALQMGGELIAILAVIGGIVAALLVAWTIFSFVARHRQELAVIKAVGGKPSEILLAVTFQSLLLTLAAYGLSITLALGVEPFLGRLFPSVAIEFSSTSLLRTGAAAIVVGTLAAMAPALRAVRIDPVTVFQS